MMRLTPPEAILSGKIGWNTQDILALNEKSLQALRGREIGMIFQNPLAALNPVFTIGEHLIETLQHHHPLSDADARKRAIELLTQVRISNPAQRLKEYPHQLSLGMCQRVVIALTLGMQPKLLIADEPTASLDVTVQAQILGLLHELKAEQNMSMLLISHDMAVIAQNCDWVMVMYRGQLVEQGTPKALFESPQHPYTQALISAIPTFGKPRPQFEGEPDETEQMLGAGCRFYHRCKSRQSRCLEAFPSWRESPDHRVACWALQG
jgi:oligopeptide/dipeptide ABC transporter ATP-binding protein